MAWSRVEDDMDDNRKLQRLSDAAFRLYWIAIPWARRHKTGGRLFEADVLQLCAKHRLKNPAALIAELLDVPYDYEAGCWVRVKRGVFEIHDFDDYNPPTSAERMARKRARERDDGVTLSDADVTSLSVTSPVTSDAGVTPGVTESDAAVLASTGPSRARPRAGYPDPVPEPVPVTAEPDGSSVEGFSPEATSGDNGRARRLASALSSLSEDPDVASYAARWMHHAARAPSADDLAFLRRIPYECSKLSPSVILAAIDEVADKHVGKGRPMPRATYLAGKLADLQAAATDIGATIRRPLNGRAASAGEVLRTMAPLAEPPRDIDDDE